MEKHPPYMTTAEFSSATGVPPKKIAAWLRQGTLKGSKQAGKWMIPSDQLACVQAASPDAASGAASGPATTGNSYSVSEFSAMTYLTPFGVTEWLKKGLLSGDKDADGNWRVDSDNLDSDRVKRLRRC